MQGLLTSLFYLPLMRSLVNKPSELKRQPKACKQLVDYLVTRPKAVIWFHVHASDMIVSLVEQIKFQIQVVV